MHKILAIVFGLVSLVSISAPVRSGLATNGIKIEDEEVFPFHRVAYLESTGTQYIDTGIIIDSLDYSIESISQIVNDITTVIFGASNTNRGYPGVTLDTAGRFRYGNQQLQDTSRWLPGWLNKTVLAYRYMLVNGVGYTATGTVVDDPIEYSLYLFARNNMGRVGNFSSVRIYEFRVYKGDVLVQDLIPVRMINEIGEEEGAMFDTVCGEVFRNAGTGAFLIGEDVD